MRPVGGSLKPHTKISLIFVLPTGKGFALYNFHILNNILLDEVTYFAYTSILPLYNNSHFSETKDFCYALLCIILLSKVPYAAFARKHLNS
jgi:hypothetical protein